MSITISGTTTDLVFTAQSLIELAKILEAESVLNVGSTQTDITDLIKSNMQKNDLPEGYSKMEFKTAFTNQDLLIKTLREHGCDNFQQYEGEMFTCEFENLMLEFFKEDGKGSFSFSLKCPKNCEPNAFVEEIKSEYTANSQEATYETIKSRLSEKNLEIAEEEILEDDSIMLTINIE